jgi:PAS domain S-box-containing protein
MDSENRLQRVERRLEAQYAVSRVLARSATLDDAAPEVLEIIGEGLGWDFAGLWLTRSDPHSLRCVEVWKAPGARIPLFERMTRETTLASGVGLPGRVLADGAPAWIRDIVTDPNFPRGTVAQREGLHTGLAFPVLAGDEVLGAIEVFSRETLEVDEEVMEPLSAVGLQLGGFLQRQISEDFTRVSEARLSAILGAALDCIITMDAQGRVIDFNPAAEETFGYKRADVIGKELAALIIPPALRDRHRSGLANYLETGEGPFIGNRIELTAMRSNGEEFPIELALSDIGLPDELVFTGYVRDITERQRVEEEHAALLESERAARADAERATARLWQLQHITDAALSHLSLDDLLNELLMRIGELLEIDIAMILLRGEADDYLTIRASIGLETGQQSGRLRVGRGIAGEVAASGAPVIVDELTSSQIALPGLRRRGARSTLAVPLIIEGKVTGVLQVASTRSRQFSEDDSLLLQLAAGRMAVAIEHARLYEQEHGIAAALQRSLLQNRIPEIPGLEIAARYLPGGAGVEVGGDWFDVIGLPEGRVGLVIGDVAGRGIRAATVMGQLRYATRAYAIDGARPGKVLRRVNRLVDQLERPGLATAIYAIFDPEAGTLTWARAGHPPPLVRNSDGVRFLEGANSLPLGVTTEAQWSEDTVSIEAGATLLLYTDGLLEHRHRDVEAGLKHLKAAAESAPDRAESLCDHILQEIFGGEEITDDAALVALRLVPYSEPLMIRLPAVPSSVGSLRRVLRKWLEGAGVGDEEIFEIIVACGEAVSNSIEHAYGLGEGDIELEAAMLNGEVAVTVRDYGRWRAERETDRGRGFTMMRELMDDVDITPASGGTEVRLTRAVSQ